MGVYELSGAGSIKTGRTLYTSMNAGNQYGAMVPIATATLASAGAFSFVNIPQTFQDLMLVVYSRNNTDNSTDLGLKINNNQSNTATTTVLNGNGSSATSYRNSNPFGFALLGYSAPANATAGIFASQVTHFLNYANTSTLKTAITRSANDLNGSGNATLTVALWPLTAAISQLDFSAFGGTNFAAGSTATLYGIRAVSS
jgi:hypothetical protein